MLSSWKLSNRAHDDKYKILDSNIKSWSSQIISLNFIVHW